MKIFISWSGETSHKVAMVFRNWLPKVLQSVEPYVSSEDIDKGTRWSIDVATELESSAYGILCVTKSNQSAPWLNFEAGALSKSLKGSRVSPFLIDLKKSEIQGPLQQFQLTSQDKDDIKKLIFSIRSVDVDCKLSERDLDDVFEMWWPQLIAALTDVLVADPKGVATTESGKPKIHESELAHQGDILEEILQLSRQNSRLLGGNEKILVDLMDSMMRQSPHFLDRNFSHPAIIDVIRSWLVLRNYLRGINFGLGEASDGQLVRPEIERMDRAVEYLDRHSSDRKIRRPQSSAVELPSPTEF